MALLLSLREADEREAQRLFAERQRAVDEAHAALERAESSRAERRLMLKPSPQGARAGRLATHERHQAEVRRLVDEATLARERARRTLRAAETACEEARAALELAFRRRRRTQEVLHAAERKASLKRRRREEREAEELTAAKRRR